MTETVPPDRARPPRAAHLENWDAESPRLESAVQLFQRVWPGRFTYEHARERLMEHSGAPGYSGMFAIAPGPGADGAISEAGEVLAGLAYGYTNLRNQWWYDQVELGIGKERCALDITGTFCVTELAVDEHWRRQGIGQLLHDTLIEHARHGGHDRAVLSTQFDNLAAIDFYLKRGWVPLVAKMFFDGVVEPYLILTRKT